MNLTPTRIVVSRGPGETRAGLFSDDVLIEVAHIRAADAQPGSVYAARVGERSSGTHDVFVDIGVGPQGLMETKGHAISSGQLVCVEVLTPARADKGPKLRLLKTSLPSRVTEPSLVTQAPDPVQQWWSRYQQTITTIEVEPASHLSVLRGLLGSPAPVILAEGPSDFDDHIESALQPTVSLPSGGRVTFEPTRALVAVDIDAGSATPETANAEAMAAIAVQMRLRQLAGHVVIDLIPTRNRRTYITQLKDATSADPNAPQVMGLTPSGMIDVVRRRTVPSLAEVLCNERGLLSAETVAYRALRRACAELLARKAATVTLHVAPDVRTVLNEKLAGALTEAQSTAHGVIAVVSQPDFARTRVEVS